MRRLITFLIAVMVIMSLSSTASAWEIINADDAKEADYFASYVPAHESRVGIRWESGDIWSRFSGFLEAEGRKDAWFAWAGGNMTVVLDDMVRQHIRTPGIGSFAQLLAAPRAQQIAATPFPGQVVFVRVDHDVAGMRVADKFLGPEVLRLTDQLDHERLLRQQQSLTLRDEFETSPWLWFLVPIVAVLLLALIALWARTPAQRRFKSEAAAHEKTRGDLNAERVAHEGTKGRLDQEVNAHRATREEFLARIAPLFGNTDRKAA